MVKQIIFCWLVFGVSAVCYSMQMSETDFEAGSLVSIIVAYLASLGCYWYARRSRKRRGGHWSLIPQLLNLIVAFMVGATYAFVYASGPNDTFLWAVLAVVAAFVIQLLVRSAARK